MAEKGSRDGAGRGFRFRVSDVIDVPLRGCLLRLRLLEGTAAVGELATGRRLRLAGPGGALREVTIVAHPVTAGRQTQARLDRTREMDVMISDADAAGDDSAVGIGWTASGPVDERG